MMRIFLTGFMGCGKSRRGRELSAHLGWEFIDIDNELVDAMGMPITEYFALHGEPAFRVLESKLLREFDYPEHCIVAVGGGLPCYFGNMEWMNANGNTVYLRMDPAALVSRLNNRQKRPLIKDMNDEQLLDFIHRKLAERTPFYEQAKVIVEGLGLDSAKLMTALQINP